MFVCNDECMCIVRLINNTILVLMYVDVRLVTDYWSRRIYAWARAKHFGCHSVCLS